MQVSWPVLSTLTLSAHGLDEEALLLLGIVEANVCDILALQQSDVRPKPHAPGYFESYKSRLPHFPRLDIILISIER